MNFVHATTGTCRPGARVVGALLVWLMAGAAAWAQLAPSRPPTARTGGGPIGAPPARAPRASAPAAPRSTPTEPLGYVDTSDLDYTYDNRYLDYLRRRLEIGTRMTWFSLSEDTRPADPELTYIGDLNRLEDEQDNSIFKLFVAVNLHRYVAVELTSDTVAARPYNFSNMDSDGLLEMSGPILMLNLRYPLLNDRLMPYVGIGYAWMDASWENSGWWGQGWEDREAYEAAGSTGYDPRDIRRYMEVESDNATVFSLGCVYQFHDLVAVDVLMRWMDLSSNALFYRTVEGDLDWPRTKTGAFVMDHVAYGLGVRYCF